MTIIKPFREFVEEEMPNYLDSKENPDEWYVLVGDLVGEYSVWADEELPEDYDEIQADMPPEDRDANPNVDGFMQIGSSGWASSGFDFGEDGGFVSEVQWGDKIERNLLSILLVHEDVLSEEALDAVENPPEVPADD